MTLKRQIARHVASIVKKAEQQADELPAYARKAKRALARARKNPELVIIGAFALGVALAKAARHA